MLTAEITYPSSSPDTGLSESTGDSSDLEVGWTEKVTLFHSKKKHYYETSTVMLHIIGRSHGDRHQSRIFVWYASFFIAAAAIGLLSFYFIGQKVNIVNFL